MKQHPLLVSVIIPTYNREELVQRAIQSVLNQTWQHIQLIVVDDGSTDRTQEILKNVEGIEYIYQPNQGQGAARNRGLKEARGTFIATLDSDDFWYPDFLEEQVTNIEKHQLDFGFVNWHQDNHPEGTFDFLRSFYFIKRYHKQAASDAWILIDYPVLRQLFTEACICPSSALVFRRSSFPEKWNENMNIADDWFLLLEIIMSKQARVGFTFKTLWKKSIQQDNICEGQSKAALLRKLYLEDFRHIINYFDKSFSRKEKNIFRRQYLNSLLKLADHYFSKKHPGYWAKATILTAKAWSQNPKWSSVHYLRKFPNFQKKLNNVLYR